MRLHIESMHCGGCARAVTRTIQHIDPQARVDADPPSRKVEVETTAASAAITSALEEAGFPAQIE
ncbi:MAG: heavy-metal-associated domain-containing protein [Lysobacteraceae bacterium]